MQASYVVTILRTLLLKDETSVTWTSDVPLLLAISLAQRAVLKKRPGLLVATAGTVSTVSNVTASTDTMVLDEDKALACAYHAASTLFSGDQASTKNESKAAQFYALFEKTVME